MRFFKRKEPQPEEESREAVKEKLAAIKKVSTVGEEDPKELVSGIARGDSG
jgi:hypothetical protein